MVGLGEGVVVAGVGVSWVFVGGGVGWELGLVLGEMEGLLFGVVWVLMSLVDVVIVWLVVVFPELSLLIEDDEGVRGEEEELGAGRVVVLAWLADKGVELFRLADKEVELFRLASRSLIILERSLIA